MYAPNVSRVAPGALATIFLISAAFVSCGDAENSSAGDAPTSWEEVARADVSSSQAAMLSTFETARNDLASTLFAELTGAVKAGGHAEAISVCQDRAPAIAQEVSEKHGVQIGRTSARLRNESNEGPEWSKGLLESDANETLFVRGDNEMRALFPIMIAPACLACHGPKEDLADGVAAALSERYASDRATGFAAGDLRGWFWVENGKD